MAKTKAKANRMLWSRRWKSRVHPSPLRVEADADEGGRKRMKRNVATMARKMRAAGLDVDRGELE
jgi:hypothetical protein